MLCEKPSLRSRRLEVVGTRKKWRARRRHAIYLVGSRRDVIDCGVELPQGFQATRLPLATKAKVFVHPFGKMFTVGESRPILLMQIMYNAVKKLRDGLASRHLSAL